LTTLIAVRAMALHARHRNRIRRGLERHRILLLGRSCGKRRRVDHRARHLHPTAVVADPRAHHQQVARFSEYERLIARGRPTLRVDRLVRTGREHRIGGGRNHQVVQLAYVRNGANACDRRTLRKQRNRHGHRD